MSDQFRAARALGIDIQQLAQQLRALCEFELGLTPPAAWEQPRPSPVIVEEEAVARFVTALLQPKESVAPTLLFTVDENAGRTALHAADDVAHAYDLAGRVAWSTVIVALGDDAGVALRALGGRHRRDAVCSEWAAHHMAAAGMRAVV